MDPYESYEPPLQVTQPITSRELAGRTQVMQPERKRRRISGGCVRVLLLVAVVFGAYLFTPLRNNVLILGIDRTPDGSDVGRSDTMILLSANPLAGRIDMLSIPRDLWVPIPGYYESRINAAHAFGEASDTGSGPFVALQTVREDFDINVSHYIRIRLTGFADVIDALGGVDITLDSPQFIYPAGTHHLDGTQALAFVRDRTGDDFFRMVHGQTFIVAMGKKLLNPLTWLRIPGALIALNRAVDTNLPFWIWPRFAFVFTRAILFNGLDARSLPREMVTPWVTAEGAQVLLPNWDLILPYTRDMFGLF
jgi:LCP family protein required for cell wall assembly